MNRDFEKVLKGIVGKSCWGVRPGHGSFLTIEFGRPHLEVREPIAVRKKVTAKVREQMGRRRVYIHGEWHFWIKCCDWEVRYKGKRVGDSSTKARIRRAADFLDGQKLIRFSILPRKAQSIFVFDLGASLKTFPYDKGSQQWLLFEPSKKVLVLRADGQYQYVRSETSADEGTWRPV
jgi:hypothetical protein